MTNNNHRTKSKRIQCKDISTLALLRFVALWTDKKSSVTLFKHDDEPRSVWTIMLPVIPMCVMKQKFENMVRKGLIDGCYCGCRGDFIITQRGRQRIALLEEVQARRTKEYLDSIYDLAGIAPGIVSSRQLARELIVEVEGLIRKGQLTALDSLLGSVDFQRINFHTASGLLRTSARLKDRLDNWHPALSRFDQHLQLKYPSNREHILVGFNHLLEQENDRAKVGG